MSKSGCSKNILHRWAELTLQHCDLSYISEYQTRLIDNSGQFRRIDIFVNESTQDFPHKFYVECKWQETSGSAWEKIHKAIDDAISVNDRPTVLLIDGTVKEMRKMRELAKARRAGNLYDAVSLFEFWMLCQKQSSDLGRKHKTGNGRYDRSQRTLF